jgi:hypothetical protein
MALSLDNIFSNLAPASQAVPSATLRTPPKDDFLDGLFQNLKKIPEKVSSFTQKIPAQTIGIGPTPLIDFSKKITEVPQKVKEWQALEPHEKQIRGWEKAEELTLPFLRKYYPSGVVGERIEKKYGQKFSTPEEIKERAPVASFTGELLGDITNLVSLSYLTAGAGSKIATPAVLKTLSPWAARAIPAMVKSGATWGLKGFLDEALEQYRQEEFKPESLATETGKEAAFGAFIGPAGEIESKALRTIGMGAARGGWATLQAYLKDGSIDSEDILNITANAALGAIFSLIGAEGVSRRIKDKRLDDFGRELTINRMRSGPQGISRKAAEIATDTIRKLGSITKSQTAIYQQASPEALKRLGSLSKEQQYKVADSIVDSVQKAVKQGQPLYQAIFDSLQKIGSQIPIGFTIKEVTPEERAEIKKLKDIIPITPETPTEAPEMPIEEAVKTGEVPQPKQAEWIVDQIFNNESPASEFKNYLIKEGGITEEMADKAVETRIWVQSQPRIITNAELANKLAEELPAKPKAEPMLKIEEAVGVKPTIPTQATKGVGVKEEFKVGDILDPQGNTNMVGKVKIREIKGNTLKFIDSEGTEFAGMQRSLVRDLIKGGSWKKVEPQPSVATKGVGGVQAPTGIKIFPKEAIKIPTAEGLSLTAQEKLAWTKQHEFAHKGLKSLMTSEALGDNTAIGQLKTAYNFDKLKQPFDEAIPNAYASFRVKPEYLKQKAPHLYKWMVENGDRFGELSSKGLGGVVKPTEAEITPKAVAPEKVVKTEPIITKGIDKYTSAEDFAEAEFGVSPTNQIGMIDTNKITPRDPIDQSSVDRIKADIKAGKEIEPIIATEKDGVITTTEGSHRAVAYQQLGQKAPIIITDGNVQGLKTIKDVFSESKTIPVSPEIKPTDNSLIRAIHAAVREKGLTKKAFEDIKMEYGGARHLVGRQKRMTTEQLQSVLGAVQKARPRQIGWKKVVTRKTEKHIQDLYNNLQKEGAMTPAHYEDILRKENVVDWKTGQVREPRYIDSKYFITERKGKDIIDRMLDEAYVIKQTESLNKAVRENPKINKVVDRIDRKINLKKDKGVRDPISLESMRYYNQQAELKTGAPIFNVYQDLINTHLENVKGRTTKIEQLKRTTPSFKKIATDEKALQRVSDYIASKSRLVGRPDMPADITPEEIKLANGIEKIFKEYENKVRLGKFLNWYYYNKPIADYDRYRPAINKGKDIYESQGINGLKKYLETQEWGVIKSGYEPMQVAFPKMKLYKIGPTAVGKGHINIRLDPTYRPQERNIIQRLSSYMKQMDTLSELQPKIKTLVRLYDDNWDKFKNPQRVKGEIETFLNELKGYGMGGGAFERTIARLYSQAMRTIILPSPVLFSRNLLQNVAFAPDKSILIDPRNKVLTKEDIKYINTYVLQTKPMIDDWFLSGEKALPGLGWLSKMVDKVKIYPYSDTANRYWGFWAKKNQVDRALRKAKTTEQMMKSATFEDMTLLEQKMALGILARDGEQAMARYVARAYADKIHFLYERAQRSPIEMGPMGRTMGNLMLFPRAYFEMLTKNAGKVIDKSEPVHARLRGLKVIFSVIVGGLATGWIYKKATGRRQNPYDPLTLLAYEPGGLALSTIQITGKVYTNMIMAATGDKRALAELTTVIPDAADMLIPFYNYALRGLEATTDMKNIDKFALRKLRSLIDKEYEARGGAYQLERNTLEKWQYFLAGAGIDTQIQEREKEQKISLPGVDLPELEPLLGITGTSKSGLSGLDKFLK